MLISIVIATYNRSDKLKEVLESLLKQETRNLFDYEVILVDNNSKDATKQIVNDFQPRFKGRLKYFFEPVKGKTNAVNKGIHESAGAVIAFTDDDTVVDTQWLWNIVACFKDHPCDGMGGRILPLYPDGAPQWVKDNKKILAGPIVIYDYGEEVKKYGKPMFEFLGANFAFKKEVFTECGLFRTDIGPGLSTMGEDTEFTHRVLEKGKNLYYNGKALVYHPVDPQRMTLRYIAKWDIALGRYRVVVDEKSELDRNLIYYLGIPRYLIRDMLQTAYRLILVVFNKPEFLKAWNRLMINVGRSMEYRRIFFLEEQNK